MGHYGRRPDPEGRAGADIDKRNKEIRHGRIKRESPLKHSITEQKRRLNELETAIFRESNPQIREELCEQYANLAATCKPEVFVPSEIMGIEKLSDLSDPDIVWSIDKKNSFPGSRPDFLPLHHLVKLLEKDVPQKGEALPTPGDTFVYLLGSSSNDTPTEPPARNLRGLEYCLLTFAYRMTVGTVLQVEIDRRRVQVAKTDKFKELRRTLDKASIIQMDHYTLRKIADGNYRVITPLHIIAEQKSYKTGGEQGVAVVSYLTTKPPVKG